MSSENAKAVAEEVIKRVSNGEQVNFREIHEKHGYSRRSARSLKAKTTKTYQTIMKPVIEQLAEHRQELLDAIKLRDLNGEPYKDLIHALDVVTKNHQLLSGDPTEITKNKEIESLSDQIRNLIEEVKK